MEKKIKAVERAREVMDMENMHGAEMAQGIEMNEEIEEKLVLIKRLQSKLRFFRGTALAPRRRRGTGRSWCRLHARLARSLISGALFT